MQKTQYDKPVLSALVLINGYAVLMEALYKQNAIHIFFLVQFTREKGRKILKHRLDVLSVMGSGAWKWSQTHCLGW